MSPPRFSISCVLIASISAAQTRHVIEGRDNTWLITACVVGGVILAGIIFCVSSMVRTRWRASHRVLAPRAGALTGATTLISTPEQRKDASTVVAPIEGTPLRSLSPVTIAERRRQSKPPRLSLSHVVQTEETKENVVSGPSVE